MNDDIKLPELPAMRLTITGPHPDRGHWYSAEQMQAYARAAVELNRAVPGIDREDIALAAQMLTWGEDEGLTACQDAVVRAHQRKLLDAIEASPPSEHGEG